MFLPTFLGVSCAKSPRTDLSHGRYVDPEGAPVPTEARLEAEYLQNQVDARDRYIAKLEADLKAVNAFGQSPDFTTEYGADGTGTRDIRVEYEGDPAEKGFRILLLDSVLFDSGLADLTPQGRQLLTETAGKIHELHPERRIVVRGHTDSEPIARSGWRSNWELGAARSLNVLHYLVSECGISEDRVSAQSFGTQKPVEGNETPEGRRLNRRTELTVMPEGFRF
jgi:flagellar motor protein MotB